MITISTEEEFSHIPKIRKRRDECGSPIAVGRRKVNRMDHLYWHGPGKLAVFYERPTQHRAKTARKWFLERCGNVIDERIGDYDGIVIFAPTKKSAIPDIFFRSSRIASQKAIDALAEYRRRSRHPVGVQR